MLMMVKYLHKEKRSGIFRYRRRVPRDLQGVLGKGMFDISLETKDPDTARMRRDQVHKGIEAKLAKASARNPDQLEYEHRKRVLTQAGLMRRREDSVPPIDPADQKRALEFRDALRADYYKRPPEKRGLAPKDLPPDTKALIGGTLKGLRKPEVHLRHAIATYVDERSTKHNFNDLSKQTRLVVTALEEIVREKNPALIDITRDDAYALRDYWINKGLAPQTARRRLNVIRAAINFAIKRFQIKDYMNPFAGVEVKGVNRRAKESRDALTLAEIRRCDPHIRRLNQDAQDLWDLMMFTGARPKELTTLEKRDVVLDHPVPHIFIRDNELGRVKSANSRRKVPLVGKALEVAQRRLKELQDAPDGAPFIDRYARRRGSDSATQLLSKAMKAAGVWQRQKKVPYSLRHSVKDWLRRVTSEYYADLIQGHGGASVSRNYGSDDMLDLLRERLIKALEKAGVEV